MRMLRLFNEVRVKYNRFLCKGDDGERRKGDPLSQVIYWYTHEAQRSQTGNPSTRKVIYLLKPPTGSMANHPHKHHRNFFHSSSISHENFFALFVYFILNPLILLVLPLRWIPLHLWTSPNLENLNPIYISLYIQLVEKYLETFPAYVLHTQ